MALLQQDHAFDVLRSIVDKSPADQTEVSLTCTEDRFLRYAGEGPTQDADRERNELSIRVRLAGDPARGPFAAWREASASCGTLNSEDAEAALARALELAEVAEPNTHLVPLGGPNEVPETAPERPTMDHTLREKADWVRLALEACEAQDLVPSGMARTTTIGETLVNSMGRAVHGCRTRASFSLTASPRTPEGGSGFAEGVHANVDHIDAAGVVERAVEKALMNRSPQGVEPDRFTVVLEPSAVSSLLLFAGYHGFGARETLEKSSFLCGRVGQRLFPDMLRILDDAQNAFYPGLPFDGEGTRRKRVELLTGGALQGPVTDQRLALEMGVENTGHARRQPSVEGPAVRNLYVAPGHSTLDELVKGVERGLLISQFHYTNMIEPRDLTLTGMTRNGTFMIEGGEVRHAVKNLRFTQGLVQALTNVTGVGSQLEIAGALFDGEVVCPALRIDDFRFTSTTDF